MKSGSLSMILSVAAVAGFALVYVKLDRLEEKVELGRSDFARPTPVEAEPERAPVREARLPDRSPRDDAHAAKEPRPKQAEAPMSRAEMEKRIAALEARVKGRKKSFPVRHSKQLSKILQLTPTQRDRVQAAVEVGKRRVEEILRIPDESGISPFERRRQIVEQVREAARTGDWAPVKRSMGTLPRNPAIPGRNTTYRAEISRIVHETQEEIASGLSVDQRERLAQTTIAPMLDEGGVGPDEMVGYAKRVAFESEADRER